MSGKLYLNHSDAQFQHLNRLTSHCHRQGRSQAGIKFWVQQCQALVRKLLRFWQSPDILTIILPSPITWPLCLIKTKLNSGWFWLILSTAVQGSSLRSINFTRVIRSWEMNLRLTNVSIPLLFCRGMMRAASLYSFLSGSID